MRYVLAATAVGMSRFFKRTPFRPAAGAGATSTDTVAQRARPVAINKAYMISSSHGVRDIILEKMARFHNTDAFCAPFVAHMKKIRKDALDGYSELEFVLVEYDVRLVFRTPQMEKNEMTYRLPDLTMEPDHRLQDKRGVLQWILGSV